MLCIWYISFNSLFAFRSYGTMPNPIKSAPNAYKNQPGRIENYTTGHSSVSEKEKKEASAGGAGRHAQSLSLVVPKLFTLSIND